MVLITSVGSELAGKVITKQVVAQLLKRAGAKAAIKQVVQFVPFIGQAVAASVSFGAMMYLGNSHIDDCYSKRYIEKV
ncbi:hypothetical protein [Peribacillus kribbensis]|uniref:hypothetical protein n=1 Tax=Peribacillus kribbensis TaxID=356658 RepID=UPI0006885361|nr:hypothetical protein [Peribacillus kribbensis]